MSVDLVSTWPPKNLSTPTVHHSRSIFNLSYSIRINAPAALVFGLVRDVSTYPTWNSWVPNVTIHSQPDGTPSDSQELVKGTSFTFHVIMDFSKPHSVTDTQLRLSDLSAPTEPSSYVPKDALEEDPSYSADLSKVYRIAWKGEGGFVSRGLSTERFHEVIPINEHECEVRTWEVMGGFLARTVKWFYEKTLNEKFEVWCGDLKKESEKRYQAQQEGGQ
jgi:Polyketide cyclase / dehydrase and lipid transport